MAFLRPNVQAAQRKGFDGQIVTLAPCAVHVRAFVDVDHPAGAIYCDPKWCSLGGFIALTPAEVVTHLNAHIAKGEPIAADGITKLNNYQTTLTAVKGKTLTLLAGCIALSKCPSDAGDD